MTLKSVLNLCCDLSGEKCSDLTMTAGPQILFVFSLAKYSIILTTLSGERL